MNAIGIVAVVAACGGPVVVPPAPPPLRPTPKPVAKPSEPVGTAFAGLVMLDGEPVRYFGVVVAKNFASTVPWETARVVRSKDGRFRVPVKEPGSWDLVIAGPGFAHHLVTGKTVEDGKTVDIGDVVVMHGDIVNGLVRDASGAPVPDAEVAIVSMPGGENDGALDQLAHGNVSAISNDEGRYEIDEFSILPLHVIRPQISATTRDHRIALPVTVPYGNQTIDLVVAPVSTLEVRLNGSVQGKVFVRSIANPRAFVQGHQTGGVFRLDAPAGDYDVVVFSPAHGPPPPPQRVTLAPGAILSLAIAVTPVPTVAIKVQVTAMTCDDVELSVPGDDAPVATSRCNGSDADLIAVEPGMYIACATGTAKPACGSFRVGTTANQRFEIGEKP